MSSILKALKKLETENAIRNHDPLKIDAEILRDNAANRVSPVKATLVAVLLFVCGSGVTYFYMKQNREMPHAAAKTANSPVAKTNTLPASQPVPAGIPVEHIEPETIVAATAEPDMKTDRTASQIDAESHVNSRQSSESPRIPRTQQKQMQHFHQKLAEKKTQPIVNKQKAVSGSRSAISLQIPALRVNGIAYQDGSDSVAVVNGVPVSKGSTIEGVKVDEIQRERILFSYGGERFTVQLGKSSR